MNRPRFLIPKIVLRRLLTIFHAALLWTTPAWGFEHAVPVVELGPSMESTDGFRVKFDVAMFPPNNESNSANVPLFAVAVPRLFSGMRLGIVFLEIEGKSGETLLATSLEGHSHGGNVRYTVNAVPYLASQCVLHFQYGTSSNPHRYVRDYVLRLKYHSNQHS
jgi:hypothetical protein